MKSFPSFCVRNMVCAIILLLPCVNANASHIVGADLYYTYVSGNTYKITMVLYGDCGPMSSATFATLPISSPQVCIYNGSTYDTSISLAIDTPTAGVEITPICPGDSTQCINPSSPIPGVKKFVYSGTYTLPSTSAVWRFIYSGNNGAGAFAGRAAAITNLSAASATYVQIIDTLNNTVSNNSNPTLTVTQKTYFCANQHDIYNPGAVDPDGDSLSVTLVPAANGTGSCSSVGGAVGYVSTAYPGGPVTSGSFPITVTGADSFSMNTTTGDMFFYPVIQRSVVVYNIREYRSGTVVGTSQREMSVLTIICSGLPCDSGSTSGTLNATVLNNNRGVEIYPNPATDELTINVAGATYDSYTICNTVGKTILQAQLTSAHTYIDVKSFPAGIYYVTLKGKDGTTVRKFVKM